MTYERSPRSLSFHMHGNVNKEEHFCSVKFRMIHQSSAVLHTGCSINKYIQSYKYLSVL